MLHILGLGGIALTQEAEAGGWVSEFKTTLGYTVRPCLKGRRVHIPKNS